MTSFDHNNWQIMLFYGAYMILILDPVEKIKPYLSEAHETQVETSVL